MKSNSISAWKKISFINILFLIFLFIIQGCGSGGDSSGSKADSIPTSAQAVIGGGDDNEQESASLNSVQDSVGGVNNGGLGSSTSIPSNSDQGTSNVSDVLNTNIIALVTSTPTNSNQDTNSVSSNTSNTNLVNIYSGRTVYGPVFYVTQSGSGNGDGSSYTNAMSVAAHNNSSFSGDTIIYLCDTFTSQVTAPSSGTSGHPIVYRGDYPGHTGVIDGNYVLQYGFGKAGSIYLTIDSLTLMRCLHAGILVQPAGASTTDPLYVTINNCTIHDISDESSNGNGIDGRGVGLTVYNCSIYNTWYDGIYHSGQDTEISYCNIYNVDQTTGTPGGDCIQLNGSNYHVHHNTLDHTNKATKHCFIAQNTSNIVGSTSVFEFNTCTSLNSGTTDRLASFEDSTNGQTIRSNTFCGGHYLITPLGSADIYNNYFTDTDTWAISIQSSTPPDSTLNIYNNTFTSMNTSSYGCITIPDVALTVNFKNNIVHSARNGVSMSGTSARVNSDYNDFYAVTMEYNGCSGGTHDITLDPLLSGYTISGTSPCKDTGTTIDGVTTDIRGMARPQGLACDIGAYEYSLR